MIVSTPSNASGSRSRSPANSAVARALLRSRVLKDPTDLLNAFEVVSSPLPTACRCSANLTTRSSNSLALAPIFCAFSVTAAFFHCKAQMRSNARSVDGVVIMIPSFSASSKRLPSISSATESALSTGTNIIVISISAPIVFAYSRLASARTCDRIAIGWALRRAARSESLSSGFNESRYASIGTFTSIGTTRLSGRLIIISGRMRPSSPSEDSCSL